jgi:hypothetical protein
MGGHDRRSCAAAAVANGGERSRGAGVMDNLTENSKRQTANGKQQTANNEG